MDLFEDRTGIALPRAPLGRGNSDRRDAAEWAAGLLERQDFVLLDTETTGFGPDAEIIEIGILSADGLVLLDVALRPQGEIPPDAAAVHGITEGRLAGATTFPQIYQALADVLRDKIVIIYNADYDWRLLRQTCRRYGLDALALIPVGCLQCAMLEYAKFVGDWNQRRQSYRWPKLQGGDHSAIGDCRATLRVLQEMARAAG